MLDGGLTGKVGEPWYESIRIKKRISVSVLPTNLSKLAIFGCYGSFCSSNLRLDKVFSRGQSVAFSDM